MRVIRARGGRAMRLITWALLAALSVAGPVVAQENSKQEKAGKEKPEWRSWPLGQRLTVSVGGYRPAIDTELNLTAGPILGQINFEQNLGLDDTKSSPIVGLNWRFFKRHSLRVNYFELDRSGAGTAPANISVCDEPGNPSSCIPLPIDWPVNSFIDTKVLNIGYQYSLIFNQKMNWGVGLGLSVQDFKLGILTEVPPPFPPGPPIEAESGFTAPLPTLATTFSYAFNDKWILDASFDWLDVNFDLGGDGQFDGRILGFDVGVRWQTWDHFGFSLAYQSFDLDLDVTDNTEFAGAFDYTYRGPRLSVNAFF